MDDKPKQKRKNTDLNARRLRRFDRWGERANYVMTAGILLTLVGSIVAFALDFAADSLIKTLANWVFRVGVVGAGIGMAAWVLIGALTAFEHIIQWAESLGAKRPDKRK
jgi:hypothetical protein